MKKATERVFQLNIAQDEINSQVQRIQEKVTERLSQRILPTQPAVAKSAQLLCGGSACHKCEKCRDWYDTTADLDDKARRFRKLSLGGLCFKKRTNTTCNLVRLYGLLHPCRCTDNKDDNAD
ncbi:unnamed protein product [Adineta ricciae]|uniref:Uncharacterized protein n=1 Tax=Adineta ricciae TaxID=249248 RepID=A0A816DJ24_ADIRI|nr:unnamed protein product [Adineta ricciae]CAF1639153.1 unnamed protein product [Adineta ricciae]